MSQTMNIHWVESIELTRHIPDVSDSRKVLIKFNGGQKFEITFFGKTDDLEGLTKSDDFDDSKIDEAF